MGKPYRIVIAEDHRILREGLRSLLSSNPDFKVVAEAADGLDAIRCVGEHKPGEVKSRCPGTKLIVLTVHKAEEYIFESLKAGADGYLLKDATYEELTLAIKNVLDGKPYLSPGISGKLVDGYLKGRKMSASVSRTDVLTKRERQILKLIAEGHKNREIADYLCISIKTVEKHRANLMKKLNLHNASAITAYALEKGMLAK